MQLLPEDDRPDSFGVRLVIERKRLGLELHEMAHLAGITDYLQKRYENNTSSISIEYLQAIYLRRDIDLHYLISGERKLKYIKQPNKTLI